MATMPQDLRDALSEDGGRLSIEQQRRLFTFWAGELGLAVERARELARDRELPHSPVGIEMQFLADNLAEASVSAA